MLYSLNDEWNPHIFAPNIKINGKRPKAIQVDLQIAEQTFHTLGLHFLIVSMESRSQGPKHILGIEQEQENSYLWFSITPFPFLISEASKSLRNDDKIGEKAS